MAQWYVICFRIWTSLVQASINGKVTSNEARKLISEQVHLAVVADWSNTHMSHMKDDWTTDLRRWLKICLLIRRDLIETNLLDLLWTVQKSKLQLLFILYFSSCSSARFIVKLDDDATINWKLLIKILQVKILHLNNLSNYPKCIKALVNQTVGQWHVLPLDQRWTIDRSTMV